MYFESESKESILPIMSNFWRHKSHLFQYCSIWASSGIFFFTNNLTNFLNAYFKKKIVFWLSSNIYSFCTTKCQWTKYDFFKILKDNQRYFWGFHWILWSQQGWRYSLDQRHLRYSKNCKVTLRNSKDFKAFQRIPKGFWMLQP